MKTRAYLAEVSLKPSAADFADSFPFSLPVVRSLERLALHPKVTFLVGENGSGKSTLLEAMAVAMGFNAEGGIHPVAYQDTEHYRVTHDFLANPQRMLDILMGR